MADLSYMDDVEHGRNASFPALAKLAASIAHPFATFPESRFDASPLSGKQAKALAGSASFRNPLERLFLAQLTGTRLRISRKQAQRLPRLRTGRLAILMVTEPMQELEEAALLVAGASLYRHVLDSAPKPQREHLRSALGGKAFHVATLEAPMLYPSLAAYANDNLLHSVLSEPEEVARIRIAGFGSRLLAAAASHGSGPLAQLAVKRFPPSAGPGVKSLPRDDLRSVMRLLQRRMSPWAAFIG
jgi:hypothetical protein